MGYRAHLLAEDHDTVHPFESLHPQSHPQPHPQRAPQKAPSWGWHHLRPWPQARPQSLVRIQKVLHCLLQAAGAVQLSHADSPWLSQHGGLAPTGPKTLVEEVSFCCLASSVEWLPANCTQHSVLVTRSMHVSCTQLILCAKHTGACIP